MDNIKDKKIIIAIIFISIIAIIAAIVIAKVFIFKATKADMNDDYTVKASLVDFNPSDYSNTGFVKLIENPDKNIYKKSDSYSDDSKIKIYDNCYLILEIEEKITNYAELSEQKDCEDYMYTSFSISGKIVDISGENLDFCDLYVSPDNGDNFIWVTPTYFYNESDSHYEKFNRNIGGYLCENIADLETGNNIHIKIIKRESGETFSISIPAVKISQANLAEKYTYSYLSSLNVDNTKSHNVIYDKKEVFNVNEAGRALNSDYAYIFEKIGENKYRKIYFELLENFSTQFSLNISLPDTILSDESLTNPITLSIINEKGESFLSYATPINDSTTQSSALFDLPFNQITSIDNTKQSSLLSINADTALNGGESISYSLNIVNN